MCSMRKFYAICMRERHLKVRGFVCARARLSVCVCDVYDRDVYYNNGRFGGCENIFDLHAYEDIKAHTL